MGSSQSVAVRYKVCVFLTLPPSSIKRAKAGVRIERLCLVIYGVVSPPGGQNSNASVFSALLVRWGAWEIDVWTSSGPSAAPWSRQIWLEMAPAFECWLSRGALRIVVRKGAVVAERRGAL